jgi:Holliday junction resolvasome RuvABC endonuclease subunit
VKVRHGVAMATRPGALPASDPRTFLTIRASRRGGDFPPPTLKKYVTGSGKGNKNVMLQRVYRNWGAQFTDDNLADAFGMAHMISGYGELA